MDTFFYLHGWGSSPTSHKAKFFKQHFAQRGIHLQIPDLNQTDFFHLTLTRQIRQIHLLLSGQKNVTLIGSSLGGLTALWVAEQCPQVKRLVLLAPALDFLTNSIKIIGEEKYAQWCRQGATDFYHYGKKENVLLSYEFVLDMYRYDDHSLQRQLPTLILHGEKDEVISVESSKSFVVNRPWIRFIELAGSDHSLEQAQEILWRATEDFCEHSG